MWFRRLLRRHHRSPLSKCGRSQRPPERLRRRRPSPPRWHPLRLHRLPRPQRPRLPRWYHPRRLLRRPLLRPHPQLRLQLHPRHSLRSLQQLPQPSHLLLNLRRRQVPQHSSNRSNNLRLNRQHNNKLPLQRLSQPPMLLRTRSGRARTSNPPRCPASLRPAMLLVLCEH